MKFARRTCARFPGPLFRKVPDISENGSGLPLEDVTALYVLRSACPNLSGLPRHMCGRHSGFIVCRDRFPEILQIFRESGPGIAATHHFLEMFRIFRENGHPNISGTIFPKYSKYFGKCYHRNIRNISEKWSGVRLSKYPGYFRKNGPGFERSRCVF